MKDTYNDGYKTEDIKCIIVDFIPEDGKGGFPIMRQGIYVLCKDCKYWRNHGKEYPTYCVRPDLLDLYADDYGVEMTADDFCSRGEKR